MNSLLRLCVITIFFAGVIAVGVLGTSTSMTFVWPGYLALGFAGVASIVAIFGKTKFLVPNWCVGLTLAAVAYLLLRAMNSPVAYFAREDGALIITCFIAYAVFISLMEDPRSRRAVFWGFFSLVVFNLLMATVQICFGAELWILSEYQRTFADRIGGLFNHPEHFAGFLAMAVPFLFAYLIFSRPPLGTQLAIIGVSLPAIVAILLAKSLLGVLALTVGLILLAALVVCIGWSRMEQLTRKAIIFGTAGVLVVFAIMVSFNSEKVGTLVEEQLMTREGEIQLAGIWNASKAQYSESPWVGTGSRTFYFFSRKYRPEQEGPANYETEFVHNEYFQMLADYGIIGLLLMLALLIVHLAGGARFVMAYAKVQTANGALLPKSGHLGLVAGAVTSIGTLAFLAFFDFVMHVPAIAVLSAVLMGVLACPDPMANALNNRGKQPIVPGGSMLMAGRGVAFGCGVALSLFSLMFSRSEWHGEVARHYYNAGAVDNRHFNHLEEARSIDPHNPFVVTLTAHSYVKAITPDMSPAERIAYLERADQFFQQAHEIYPQDVNSAMAHSVVLDALGRSDEAGAKLAAAREWAPLHGNLMVAQGEHYLRTEEYRAALVAFEEAMDAPVFPNKNGAKLGLELIAKLSPSNKSTLLASRGATQNQAVRRMKTAKVDEVLLSGRGIFDIEPTLDESIRRLEARLEAEIAENRSQQ